MTSPSDETLPFSEVSAPLSVADLDARIPELDVIELLGKGGMGAVYRARQKRLDREVALKVLLPSKNPPDVRGLFATEARAMAKLSHPNVVVVHDFGQVEDFNYLVMELIRGQTLKEMMKTGDVSHATAYSVTSQVCQALEYAHMEGVIHRDVKPENILVERRGRVRLADFGLARLASGPESSQDKGVVGTPGYIAPELFCNPTAADHRVDIYSTGAVIYELLTGMRYRKDALLPSELGFPDIRIDDVVRRALQEDPVERYQRACELEKDVTAISRTENSTVIIQRELPAAPEEIFRAWTDRDQMEEFLAPSDAMRTEVAEVDPTVGGRFCLTMNENAAYTARGEYCRVQHPTTLSFTWAWDNADHEKNEGLITIQLRATGAGTEVKFVHERLSSRHSRDRHHEGWGGVFDRLERKLRRTQR